MGDIVPIFVFFTRKIPKQAPGRPWKVRPALVASYPLGLGPSALGQWETRWRTFPAWPQGIDIPCDSCQGHPSLPLSTQ